MQAALESRIRRESGSGKRKESHLRKWLLSIIQWKDWSRALRMPGGGVQGRQEGNCISSLPGFGCKGQYLEYQGQPKHFSVWKCYLHVNRGVHSSVS